MARRFAVVLLVCLVANLVALAAVSPAAAADIRTGDQVKVGSGEVIQGDLYIAGQSVVIEGTVNGDVFAAGQTVSISGAVRGGVTAAAEVLTINSDITGGVRAAARTANIRGTVGRDLMVLASEVVSAATIGADLMATAETVSVTGRVARNVEGNASRMTLGSEVGGNVDVKVERLVLTQSANVTGSLVYTSDQRVDMASGARVGGTTTKRDPPRSNLAAEVAGSMFGKVLGFLMIFTIGVILVFLLTGRMIAFSGAILANPAGALGWGALALVAVPVAAIIVMFTFVGLALGLIALAVYAILLYLAQLPVALLIGQLILRRPAGAVWSRGALLGALAIGLLVLLVLNIVPWFGFLVGLATIIFGLGAIVISTARVRGGRV